VAIVLGVLFQGLLTEPTHFPGTSPVDENSVPGIIGIADTIFQSAAYDASGEIPYVVPGRSDRNLAAESPALFTHPLYFALQSFLPLGLSMTLLTVLHVFLGALATYYLARRCRLGALPALFAALVFFLTGKLLNSGTQNAEELGILLVAALFPAVVLVSLRVLQRPTVMRGTVHGLVVALMVSSGDAGAAVFALILLALTVPATYFLLDVRAFTWRTTGLLSFGLIWGLTLGGYRWLPSIAEGDFSRVARVFEGSPWWSGLDGLSLPYHLGAVTLIAVLLGIRNWTRQPCGMPVLVLGAVGIALALAGPPAALPFLGFYFGLLGAAAFSGFLVAYRPFVRESFACVAIVLLILEAMPHHTNALGHTTREEIATALRDQPRTLNLATPVDRRYVLEEPSVVSFKAPVSGLTATVDGKAASLLAMGNKRLGLSLPAGIHDVRLNFSPPGLELGQTLSALAAALLPFLLAWPVLRRRSAGRRGRQVPPRRFLRQRRKEAVRQVVQVQ
jgi:hypothetical protein